MTSDGQCRYHCNTQWRTPKTARRSDAISRRAVEQRRSVRCEASRRMRRKQVGGTKRHLASRGRQHHRECRMEMATVVAVTCLRGVPARIRTGQFVANGVGMITHTVVAMIEDVAFARARATVMMAVRRVSRCPGGLERDQHHKYDQNKTAHGRMITDLTGTSIDCGKPANAIRLLFRCKQPCQHSVQPGTGTWKMRPPWAVWSDHIG